MKSLIWTCFLFSKFSLRNSLENSLNVNVILKVQHTHLNLICFLNSDMQLRYSVTSLFQNYKCMKRWLTVEVSEAILIPFGRVVIFVLPCSMWSGNEGGSSIPLRGKSKGGEVEAFPPVNQLKRPPDDDLAATALELANLVSVLLHALPYCISQRQRKIMIFNLVFIY